MRCAIVPLRAGPQALAAEAARYLLKVHRLRCGDAFVAFDPERRLEALARLTSDHPKAPACDIASPGPATLVSSLPVTLLQALGKGDKVDRVVRDATQLGAQRIVLVQSERSVPQVAGKHAGKSERYLRIALEAARQSGRGDLPQLTGPSLLGEALADLPADGLRLAFDARGERTLRELFGENTSPRSVAACIGPEGGFSESELTVLTNAGFILVRLGPFILRTETAAIAALAALAEYC